MVISKEALQPRQAKDLLAEGLKLGAMTFRWYSPVFYILTIIYFVSIHYFAGAITEAMNDIYSTVFLSFFNLLFTFLLFGYSMLLFFTPETEAAKYKRKSVRLSFLKLIFPIFGATLLFFLSFFAGSLLLLIPGLLIFVFFILFPQVIVLEGKGGLASLFRSGQLVKGSFFKVGLLFLIFLGAQGILAGTIALYIDLVPFYVMGLIGAVSHLLIVPFQAAVMNLVYLDVRSDYEAFDYKVFAHEAKQQVVKPKLQVKTPINEGV